VRDGTRPAIVIVGPGVAIGLAGREYMINSSEQSMSDGDDGLAMIAVAHYAAKLLALQSGCDEDDGAALPCHGRDLEGCERSSRGS